MEKKDLKALIKMEDIKEIGRREKMDCVWYNVSINVRKVEAKRGDDLKGTSYDNCFECKGYHEQCRKYYPDKQKYNIQEVFPYPREMGIGAMDKETLERLCSQTVENKKIVIESEGYLKEPRNHSGECFDYNE